jgi:hypothetical protein
MLIEEVDQVHFLVLRLPLQCGEHFWSAYRERVEEEMRVVLGMENIYWTLRRGFGELPRRRDFSSAHRFKSLPLTALEDTQKRWDAFCDRLREACEELKGAVRSSRSQETLQLSFSVGSLDLEGGELVSFPLSEEAEVSAAAATTTAATTTAAATTAAEQPGARWFNVHVVGDSEFPAMPALPSLVASNEEIDFCKAAIPLIKLTHTVFKKIRLRYLNAECPVVPSRNRPAPRRLQLDDLLDGAGGVPALIEKAKVNLLAPPHHHAIICQQLTQAVKDTETVIEQVKEFLNDAQQAKWFDQAHRQLEIFLGPLNEMNPFR